MGCGSSTVSHPDDVTAAAMAAKSSKASSNSKSKPHPNEADKYKSKEKTRSQPQKHNTQTQLHTKTSDQTASSHNLSSQTTPDHQPRHLHPTQDINDNKTDLSHATTPTAANSINPLAHPTDHNKMSPFYILSPTHDTTTSSIMLQPTQHHHSMATSPSPDIKKQLKSKHSSSPADGPSIIVTSADDGPLAIPSGSPRHSSSQNRHQSDDSTTAHPIASSPHNLSVQAASSLYGKRETYIGHPFVIFVSPVSPSCIAQDEYNNAGFNFDQLDQSHDDEPYQTYATMNNNEDNNTTLPQPQQQEKHQSTQEDHHSQSDDHEHPTITRTDISLNKLPSTQQELDRNISNSQSSSTSTESAHVTEADPTHTEQPSRQKLSQLRLQHQRQLSADRTILVQHANNDELIPFTLQIYSVFAHRIINYTVENITGMTLISELKKYALLGFKNYREELRKINILPKNEYECCDIDQLMEQDDEEIFYSEESPNLASLQAKSVIENQQTQTTEETSVSTPLSPSAMSESASSSSSSAATKTTTTPTVPTLAKKKSTNDSSSLFSAPYICSRLIFQGRIMKCLAGRPLSYYGIFAETASNCEVTLVITDPRNIDPSKFKTKPEKANQKENTN